MVPKSQEGKKRGTGDESAESFTRSKVMMGGKKAQSSATKAKGKERKT